MISPFLFGKVGEHAFAAGRPAIAAAEGLARLSGPAPRRCGPGERPASPGRPGPGRPARRAGRASLRPAGGASAARRPGASTIQEAAQGRPACAPLARDGPGRGGKSRAMRSPAGAASAAGPAPGTWRCAAGPCGCPAAGLHRPRCSSPAEPCGPSRGSSSSAVSGSVSSSSMTSSSPFDSHGQGRGEAHPRLGMKSLAHPQRQPGAAKQPLQAPHQVPVPDQRRSPCLQKRIRTRRRTIGSHLPRRCRCGRGQAFPVCPRMASGSRAEVSLPRRCRSERQTRRHCPGSTTAPTAARASSVLLASSS